jgi:hypothetical protein
MRPSGWAVPSRTNAAALGVEFAVSDLLQGVVMELSNYELVRYPSGQLVITRMDVSASGTPSSGPRDVVGVFTSEQEAQNALDQLLATSRARRAA